MTVDFSHLADIQYLSSSSWEVLRRQRLWQWRSFWQFECSHTNMLKEWPACVDDLFHVRNISHSSYLHVWTSRFLLSIRSVLAALPHFQKVVNLGHSVQCPFLRLFSISESFSVFIVSNCGSAPGKIAVLARANSLTTTLTRQVSPVVSDCLQPITSRHREKLRSTPTSCGLIENVPRATSERLAYLVCVSSCWHHLSVMSGNQDVLQICIGSKW